MESWFHTAVAACAQGLSYEARLLLWSLIDNNIRVLSAFLRSNLEDITSPRVADPGLWSSILVRPALRPLSVQPALLGTIATACSAWRASCCPRMSPLPCEDLGGPRIIKKKVPF